MKKLWLDTETTGRNARRHSLIQLAGIIEIDGQVKEEFDIRLRPFPGESIDDAAIEAHGIPREEFMAYPEPGKGFLEFCRILERYIDPFNKQDKFTVYAYNAAFDESFLRQLYFNCGSKFFGAYFWWPWVDIAAPIHEYLVECGRRPTMLNGKLATMAQALNVPLPDKLHDALADIRLARECWHKARDLSIRHLLACHSEAAYESLR